MITITSNAPRSPVGPDGLPTFGAFRGYAEHVTWKALRQDLRRSALWNALHLKTWHYASIAAADCVVALAIIDVGYAASAFAYVFDRGARRMLANLSFTSLPRCASFSDSPGLGAASRFQNRRARFTIERSASAWHVHGAAPDGFELDVKLDPTSAPPPLCAIADLSASGGVANCTHKSVGLRALGFVTTGGTRFDLTGASGALDHTRGLLARNTRWRWASASSPSLSLNLVEDFNGPVENVVWIGHDLVPVGPVRFDYDRAATSHPWVIHSADGIVDLAFTPEGERRENKNLLLAKSWYVQPIGTFTGVIHPPGWPPIEVRDLVGVTEDHVARW